MKVVRSVGYVGLWAEWCALSDEVCELLLHLWRSLAGVQHQFLAD